MPPAPRRRSARRIRTYLLGALDQIERTALFSDAVDWVAVRQDAESALTQARTYADTHAFLAAALTQAGGRHSHLIRAGVRREVSAEAAEALGPPLPTGRVLNAAGQLPVGYLKLPRLSGGRREARDYVNAGAELLRSLASAEPTPHGWIVDLRYNVGGNMWPMIAVAAPLLPDGPLGRFVLADGNVVDWSMDRGRARLGGKVLARSRGALPRLAGAPVAVLTSRITASAGEAVVVAFRGQPGVRIFGAPTAGFTTGNCVRVLRDGSRLVITMSHYADRDGERFDGPIPVDQLIIDNSRDARVLAALAWIRAQR